MWKKWLGGAKKHGGFANAINKQLDNWSDDLKELEAAKELEAKSPVKNIDEFKEFLTSYYTFKDKDLSKKSIQTEEFIKDTILITRICMGKDKDSSILNLATSIMSNTDSSENLKDKVREYFETTDSGLSEIIVKQDLLSEIMELSDYSTSIIQKVLIPNSQFELGETLKLLGNTDINNTVDTYFHISE
jgi:hypothetical protein